MARNNAGVGASTNARARCADAGAWTWTWTRGRGEARSRPGDGRRGDGESGLTTRIHGGDRNANRKTWNLVTDESSNDVIAWNENGRTFTVWKPDVLESEYLPKTFKHSNFASFVRQLNNYGFRKCHSDRYEFGVEGFERGRPDLLTTLKRHDAPRSKRGGTSSSGKKGETSAAAGRAGAGARLASTASLALKGDSLEIGAYGGLANELEFLKRDRALLVQEVMRLRETQLQQREEVARLKNRIEQTENFQTQMRQFVQAVHDGENINNALRESGLAGVNAALSGPRKRRGAPRYLPALEVPQGGEEEISGDEGTAHGIAASPLGAALSLEEIADDDFGSALTPGGTTLSLPWGDFLDSPTNESLRTMVEEMAYGDDDGKIQQKDEPYSFLNRMNSAQLDRQLSLSFLDSDEMNEMVKELRIEDAKHTAKSAGAKSNGAKTSSPKKSSASASVRT